MTTQHLEWAVEFYTDERGKSPVIEFINGLPAQERARVRNVLRLLQEFGVLLRLPHARPVSGRGGLWELRAGAIRLFYFAHTERRFIHHPTCLLQKVTKDPETGDCYRRAAAD